VRPVRHLFWIIPAVILLLLALPLPIAERFTSPNQDGEYAIHPIRAYGFIVALLRASDSAQLSNSGKALSQAKAIFSTSSLRPTQVRLLYFPNGKLYVYYTRAGVALTITDPPRLVWEVWGILDPSQPLAPGSDQGAAATTEATVPAPSSATTSSIEVIGFLDYVTGKQIGTQVQPNPSPT
jgi:hypothetical protein